MLFVVSSWCPDLDIWYFDFDGDAFPSTIETSAWDAFERNHTRIKGQKGLCFPS